MCTATFKGISPVSAMTIFSDQRIIARGGGIVYLLSIQNLMYLQGPSRQHQYVTSSGSKTSMGWVGEVIDKHVTLGYLN